VNAYADNAAPAVPLLKMDPEGERRQLARLERVRRERDGAAVAASLEALRAAARGSENLMPHFIACASAYATLQEMMDVLREVFGVYQEPVIL
jgi:methylmalonyl-CoA mutase N-terminal domain/subunit